jgi:hypothetical protein
LLAIRRDEADEDDFLFIEENLNFVVTTDSEIAYRHHLVDYRSVIDVVGGTLGL